MFEMKNRVIDTTTKNNRENKGINPRLDIAFKKTFIYLFF